MSEEDVQNVRAACEQLARGDFGAWADLPDDFEYVTSRSDTGASLPESAAAGKGEPEAVRRAPVTPTQYEHVFALLYEPS